MQNFRFGGYSQLPMVVKNLIIINVIFYLGTISVLQFTNLDLINILGLHYFDSKLFYPFQIITHMFMHSIEISHLLFNMLALWMFGSTLEYIWGPRKFLIYYLVGGIGSVILQFLVTYFRIQALLPQMTFEQIQLVLDEGYKLISAHRNYTDPLMGDLNYLLNIPSVGASGAIFGLLLAFGMMFPNSLIYVYFAIPVKAKYFVTAYGAIELVTGIINNPNDNVAHFAHLGGMISGLILILYWKKKGKLFTCN